MTCSIASSAESTTPHGEHEREELLGPVLLGRPRARDAVDAPRTRVVAAQLDAGVAQRAAAPAAGTRRRRAACTSSVSAALQTPGRWVLALSTIASARVEVGRRVDVHVAVARRGVDDRHLRDGAERLLQPLAAARDDQVDHALLARPSSASSSRPPPATSDSAPAGRPGRRRRPRPRPRASTSLECAADRGPAQHDRVAGLQRQRGGVDRDVRARLVDDRDHAERDAHLAHVEPVGQPEAVEHLADRVGQRDDRRARRRPSRPRGARRARAGPSARPRARTRGRPRGRARWPRGSPACAPPARRRSRAAPRP